MNNFLLQALYERRWLIGVTSVGLMLFSLLIVGLYPVLSQLHPSNPIIENMPVLFEGFLGELSHLREFPTFLASQLFTIHLPLVLGGVGVLYGWSVGVAPEQRGEYRTLLSRPMSRTGLVLRNWAVFASMTAICIAVVSLGVYVTLPLIEGDTAIAFSTFALLAGMMWLFACAVAAITCAVGMAIGRSTLAVFAGLLVVVTSYYITILSPVLPAAAEYRGFSLLEYVAAIDVVQYGATASHVGVLVAVIVGSLAVTVVMFNVRDITR